MDDYKRELYMRVRDRLMDPKQAHDSICLSLMSELGNEGHMKNIYNQSFIENLCSEMKELFDEKTWYKPRVWKDTTYNPNKYNTNYWWDPYDWVEPRIAMIDFLLNNR